MPLEPNFCAIQPPHTSETVTSTFAWETLRNRPISTSPRFTPSMWVRLHNSPTAFSFDEAWLLCQSAENQWLAWIPDYGEILLHTDEFYSLTED